MQFCDDCGSMMKADGDEMVCTNCGAGAERDDDAAFVSTESQADAGIVETEEGTEFEGKPTTSDTRCPECGHGRAYYAFLQTAAADEAPTRFLKCTDCGNRWREYN